MDADRALSTLRLWRSRSIKGTLHVWRTLTFTARHLTRVEDPPNPAVPSKTSDISGEQPGPEEDSPIVELDLDSSGDCQPSESLESQSNASTHSLESFFLHMQDNRPPTAQMDQDQNSHPQSGAQNPFPTYTSTPALGTGNNSSKPSRASGVTTNHCRDSSRKSLLTLK